MAVLFFLLCLPACDEEPSSEEAAESAPSLTHHDHTDFSIAEPTEELTTLSFGAPQRFSSCREIFEDDGEPTAWPVEQQRISTTLFGCNPDGYLELDEGRRAIAYEIAGDDADGRATDLRIVLYGEDGEVKWHRRLDRSHQKENFAANYRGSSLTAIANDLVCATTRWHDSTQALCARIGNGHITYDGRMNFWAGLDPFGFDGSLYSADSDGITRRYPYSGTEMRHRSFDDRGGRSAFYATDEERIFFVQATGDPQLVAWDLDSLRPIWRADLQDVPQTGYGPTSQVHGLLLFVVDETLGAVDAESGEFRFAIDVGDRPPPTAFSEDTLFILLRRDDDQALIYAIDLKEDVIGWVAEAPAGALDIDYGDGKLMTRSVRTVRTVELPHD